jgi:hypothetical protein
VVLGDRLTVQAAHEVQSNTNIPQKTIEPENTNQSLLERQKVSVLQQLVGLGNEKWDTDRVIWRSGELRIQEATPLLLKLIGTGEPLRDYCIAWALGWCGTESVIPHLYQLLNNPQQPDFVQRIALEAIFKLADTETENNLRLTQINKLPPRLKNLALNGTSEHFLESLNQYLIEDNADFNVINTIYQINNAKVRPALINFVKTAPFALNYFRQIRQIFKVAEYRLDAEVLGILAYRFDKELSNDIYTQKSKIYLQKRVWRTLRDLGEQNRVDYVLIATEVLLSHSDEDAESVLNTKKGRLYDIYARYLTFNHILYEHSSRYILKPNNKAWQCQQGYEIDSPAPNVREEAFPQLWEANPNLLVRLLLESNCEPVHHFAVTALKDRQEYCQKIEVNNVIGFLAKPYQETLEFAFELACNLYDSQNPNLELLIALIDSNLEIARNQALEWVSEQGKYFLSHPKFIVHLLISPHQNIRDFTQNLICNIKLTKTISSKLVKEIISKLITFDIDKNEIAKELLNLLLEYFPTYLDRLPIDLIRGLVRSNINELRDLGISIFIKLPQDILIKELETLVVIVGYQDLKIYKKIKPVLLKIGKKDFDFTLNLVSRIIDNYQELLPQELAINLLEKLSLEIIPFNLIEHLLNSSHVSIGLFAINILNKLNHNLLLNHPEIFLNLATNNHLEIRNAIKPLIIQLSYKKPNFFINLITELVNYHPQLEIQEFVFTLLKKRQIPAIELPFSLIEALVNSRHNFVLIYGLNLLADLPAKTLLKYPQVILNLAKHNDAEIRDESKKIIIRLGNKHYQFFFDLIANLLLEQTNLSILEFTINLINEVSIPLAEFPFSIIQSWLYSSYESIQISGINIFAKLPDDTLLEHKKVFLDLINTKKTTVYNAIQPIINRLANEYSEFIINLIKELIERVDEIEIKNFTISLLVNVNFPPNNNVFELIGLLLNLSVEAFPVTAVSIFGKFKDEILLTHQDLFLTLIKHENTQVRNAVNLILQQLVQKYPQFVIELINELIKEDCLENTQLWVGNFLLNPDTKLSSSYLPWTIVEFLINSEYEQVVSIGINIFTQLPSKIILQHQAIIYQFLIHQTDTFRELIEPAISKISNNLYFVIQTIPSLIKLLLKKEIFTGVHDYILNVIREKLPKGISIISKKDTEKLIKSNYKPAQNLGSLSLETNYKKWAKEYQIKQIIDLANHELLTLRQISWKLMWLQISRIRHNHQEKLTAVRLLESTWNDSSQFAQEFFYNNFTEEDWTPEVMITICDSIKEDVRAFGKELVKKYFQDARGEEYLLKFSEHPSADIQLLATDYLDEFATDNLDNLSQLKPYFNTLLSQVNKGRVAKNKVFDFLYSEAEKSESSARLIADILSRQSLTMAIGDKAKIIKMMMEIKKKYPNISLPVELKQVVEVRR